jgi:hypothetical protein
MLAPIHLDDDFRVTAHEVANEWADRHLPAELVAA